LAEVAESPGYVRLSTASDIVLGFSRGLFYRGAEPYCINLLLHFSDGCRSNCLYCGQAREAAGPSTCKSLIRVDWPLRKLEDVIERFNSFMGNGCFLRPYRICVAAITHPRAVEGEIEVVRKMSDELGLPISALISPSIFSMDRLEELRSAGADRVGIAIDCATPRIFEALRGRMARGIHKWERYLEGVRETVEIMGKGRVGVHLIVGLGETERDAAELMQTIKNMGGETHLFSFYPEAGSVLEEWPRPPMSQYRRVQIARYLIDDRISSYDDMEFNEHGQITGFGIDINGIAETGKPFMTSGCPGCNRPFSNERPGETFRNYPFPPSRREALAALRRAGIYAQPRNTLPRLLEYLKSRGFPQR
jgi:biotin synthase-related radical SAM superfamily protein